MTTVANHSISLRLYAQASLVQLLEIFHAKEIVPDTTRGLAGALSASTVLIHYAFSLTECTGTALYSRMIATLKASSPFFRIKYSCGNIEVTSRSANQGLNRGA